MRQNLQAIYSFKEICYNIIMDNEKKQEQARQFLREIENDSLDVLRDIQDRRIEGGYYPDNSYRSPARAQEEFFQHRYDVGDEVLHFVDLMKLVLQLRTKAAEIREHPTFSDVREAWKKIVPMPHFLDDEPEDTIHLRKIREDYRLIAEMIAETMATEYMRGIAQSTRDRLIGLLVGAMGDEDELDTALTDIVYDELKRDTEKTTEE